MDRCSLCRFYHQIKPGSPRSLGNGECRYRPPVVPTGSHDRFHADFAIFPVVLENDWCGEFGPRVAQVAVSLVDQANTAFDTASQEDATVANVGAVTGQCQSGRESRATGQD